ncbi:MAG: hypothetical protein AABX53_01750 [Nanoarchaeota archaeon]
MVRVGVAAYKVTSTHDVEDYLTFLEASLSKDVTLFVGPEYVLSPRGFGVLPAEPFPFHERLGALSRGYPATVLIPGTALVNIDADHAQNRAFVYSGDDVRTFDKQSDFGETRKLDDQGFVYLRGSTLVNAFSAGEMKAWLSICGDSCRKAETICHDADLEIVVSHDMNAGARQSILSPNNPRHIIVSDSFGPLAQVARYTEKNLRLITPDEVYAFHGDYGLAKTSKRDAPRRLEVYNLP